MIKILTDSSADLPKKLIDRYDILLNGSRQLKQWVKMIRFPCQPVQTLR